MASPEIVYNIPIDLIEAYRGRQLIVRVSEPETLVGLLTEEDIQNLHFVQILTLLADVEALSGWGIGVPIDLVMYEPWFEFAKLYNFAKLLDKHPVRVTIPARVGVERAVKIAGSLNFAVKLAIGQPTREELDELFGVMEMFLHQATFTRPVEFFQGSMQYFLHGGSRSVWQILEEDPSQTRFITADGDENVGSRFTGIDLAIAGDIANFVDEFESGLMNGGRECSACEFRPHCRGYFKWPDREYRCDGGIKEIFARLREAAGELREDLAVFAKATGGRGL